MDSNASICRQRVPIALKFGYGAATPVIAAVYARCYGPTNFLWLSDIALGLTTAAVITETALPASVAAVGALPLEIAWNARWWYSGCLFIGRPTGRCGVCSGRRANGG